MPESTQNIGLQLSRRDLLQGGGALVLGFSFAPAMAQVGTAPPTTRVHPGPPDPQQIDSWIAIHSDNTATIYIGFAELGQGCSTALLQVAAEELDLRMDQVRTVGLDTHVTPNQGGTYSSRAMHIGGPQIQRAAAEARLALLRLAAERLQVPASQLQVENGVISGNSDDNIFITYGELIGDQRFELTISGQAPLKSPADYRLVGQPIARRDTPQKVLGTHAYLQHQRLPAMLHGRIIRPSGQGSYGHGLRIIAVDDSSIAHLPARLLRQGNFLAVVAEREWDAIQAARSLRVTWDQPATLPGNGGLFQAMEYARTNDRVVLERGDDSLFDSAPLRTEFTAQGPYQAHAPFAPNCALAEVTADSALILCGSQDIYNTRSSIATLLGLDSEQVRVQYVEGAGTFGHSGWDDAAQAAALCSQLCGRPVRIQFSRADELGWDTYGPAHLGKVRAAASTEGKLLSYHYEGWQHHWSLVETTEQSATDTAAAEWPPVPVQQVNPLVLGGMYDIPNLRLINHHVPGLDFLKGAWLRSPLDLSFCFVSEQAIDDLAWQCGLDAWQFRQQNISNPRWRGVLDAAANAAQWQPRRAHSQAQEGALRRGRGIGLGTHLASWGGAVAEIEVNIDSGQVRILHLYGAIDAGRVVNTSNVENQIIGQLVQTASRMLLEEVLFNEQQVISLDWNSYPILRFADCPEVTPVIVQHIEEPSSGAGEEVMAAAAAAIANAFFDATGRRMQMYPFTPERVRATLA